MASVVSSADRPGPDRATAGARVARLVGSRGYGGRATCQGPLDLRGRLGHVGMARLDAGVPAVEVGAQRRPPASEGRLSGWWRRRPGVRSGEERGHGHAFGQAAGQLVQGHAFEALLGDLAPGFEGGDWEVVAQAEVVIERHAIGHRILLGPRCGESMRCGRIKTQTPGILHPKRPNVTCFDAMSDSCGRDASAGGERRARSRELTAGQGRD
jgi:hypothetical protein